MWPKARVTGHRISRCFLLSCSTDETFLGTHVAIRKLKSWLTCWPHDFTVVFSGQDSLRNFQNDNPLFLWFWRKIPTSTGYDATDHILVIDRFWWIMAGKIQLPGLNQQSTALKKIPTNLLHCGMINSDAKAQICSNKSSKKSNYHKLGIEKESVCGCFHCIQSGSSWFTIITLSKMNPLILLFTHPTPFSPLLIPPSLHTLLQHIGWAQWR